MKFRPRFTTLFPARDHAEIMLQKKNARICLDFPGTPVFLRVPCKKKANAEPTEYAKLSVQVVLPDSPLREGWTRLLVQRKTVKDGSSKRCDVYYITPTGKKLRSTSEMKRFLDETKESRYQGLKVTDFVFSCSAFNSILCWTNMSFTRIADLQNDNY